MSLLSPSNTPSLIKVRGITDGGRIPEKGLIDLDVAVDCPLGVPIGQ